MDNFKAFEVSEIVPIWLGLIKIEFIAFFEEPETEFNFKKQRDFDLHIAFEVSESDLHKMYKKGNNSEIETRGIIDHGFIKSIYFRDPNGYVIELTYPTEELNNNSYESNLNILKDWQDQKFIP